ncbi:MAG: 30S ribosomal protein S7 [Candidatus Roizmanbacteria bacterium]
MPRHQYKRQPVLVDPLHASFEIAKLINYTMQDGKKDTAKKIIYEMMDDFKNQGEDPLKLIHKAISNVAPSVEVKPRRLGGASYLVPTEVRKDRKLYLALTWILDAARAKSNKEFRSFKAKLSSEIIDASKSQGQAMTKKAQAEKLAEANKAFSHLKW